MMISRLIRTEIIGNLDAIKTVVLFNFIGFVLFIFAMQMREIGPLFIFTLLPGAIVGLYLYSNSKRERRARHFTQLPVTQLQIILSQWSFVFLFLLIPCVTLTIAALIHPNYSFTEVMRILFVAFCGFTSFIAALAIAADIAKLPHPNSRTFQFLWILLMLFCTSMIFASVESGTVFFTENGTPIWPLISSFWGITALSLVALDIWLHQQAEDYLG